MQREPSGSHTDIPLASGNHSSVTKHLHSTACLQIQWYPETHIFPSLSTVAKDGQFLERSTARSPALGLNGHSHLLFNPDNFFLRFQAGEIISKSKGNMGWYSGAVWSHSTHRLPRASSHLWSSRGKWSARINLVLWPALQERPLLNYIWMLCPSLLKSRVSVIIVAWRMFMCLL